MKKEDMKKPFSAEKQDFQPAQRYNLVKSELRYLNLLLIILLFNENIVSQVPVNGFCKFNFFPVDSGFTKLRMINFNNDTYSDLFLFNPEKDEILLTQGAINGEFSGTKKFKIPLEINFIQPLGYFPSDGFVFSSRKKRKAGIFELKPDGQPVLLKDLKFDSYPEIIQTADINADGINEVLVAGGGFSGLSVIYRQGDSLTADRVGEGTFSQAAFIELNNDGYPDIAGYEIVNRSLNFFYNNSLGEFQKIRSFFLPEKPSSLKTFDVNLDSYEDIIFASASSINIWYGDFKSSYEKTLKINTSFKPDKFIYGDFNRDGFIDIVYLNIEHSLIQVLFAKNDAEFYPEIIYLRQKNLCDLISYYSRFIDGIAVLSSDGEIYTITQISSFADNVNLSLGADPGALTFFDGENNGITDLCFIDNYDNKIKFIIRDNTGLPAFFFSQQLHENHEKIIAENLNKDEKYFICFSYNKKLIEVVKFNIKNKEFAKTVLYSPGKILDLKTRRNNEKEFEIFIVCEKNNELILGMFNERNSLFNFISNTVKRNSKIADASLGLLGTVNISFLNEEKDTLFLEVLEFNDKGNKQLIKYPLPDSNTKHSVSYTENLLNMDKNVSITFIESEAKDFAVVSDDNIISVSRKMNKKYNFRITSKNNLFFGESRFNGLKRLFIHKPLERSVSQLEFIQHGENFLLTKIADISETQSFFIKNMTSKNYHLVYANPEYNCISIKRLRN